jgi:protein involved in polysaccharide export with SLBB domain
LEKEKAKEITHHVSGKVASPNFSPLILKNLDPIVIDLKSLASGSEQLYLTMPVRPGDVIVVPGSGEVLVQGWVAKVGSYKITPGLTLLGAIAASGGPMLPADMTAVRILRTSRSGEKVSLLVDLESVARGEKPDIPVMEADVIEVPSSTPMLLVHGFYQFFSSVMHVGASVPLFR